jgi:hypothetical protein
MEDGNRVAKATIEVKEQAMRKYVITLAVLSLVPSILALAGGDDQSALKPFVGKWVGTTYVSSISNLGMGADRVVTLTVFPNGEAEISAGSATFGRVEIPAHSPTRCRAEVVDEGGPTLCLKTDAWDQKMEFHLYPDGTLRWPGFQARWVLFDETVLKRKEWLQARVGT